jgi:putative transposase
LPGLVPDHVHLILVPADAAGLRGALAEAHRRYSRRINFAHGWSGCGCGGLRATPMDDAHLARDAAGRQP